MPTTMGRTGRCVVFWFCCVFLTYLVFGQVLTRNKDGSPLPDFAVLGRLNTCCEIKAFRLTFLYIRGLTEQELNTCSGMKD